MQQNVPRIVTPTNVMEDVTTVPIVAVDAPPVIVNSPPIIIDTPPIVDPSRDLIKALLGGIVRDGVLDMKDLFVEDSNKCIVTELKARISTLALAFRSANIQEHYKKYYKEPKQRYKKKDITTLDPQNFSLLTERFGIPLLLVPAIIDIVVAILYLAEDVPGDVDERE